MTILFVGYQTEFLSYIQTHTSVPSEGRRSKDLQKASEVIDLCGGDESDIDCLSEPTTPGSSRFICWNVRF